MSEAPTTPELPQLKPPLRFRRLCIAVSVFFAAVCIASAVMWMESLYWRDSAYDEIHGKLVHAISMDGRIEIAVLHKPSFSTSLYTGQVYHEWLEKWKKLESSLHGPQPVQPFRVNVRLARNDGIVIRLPYWVMVISSAVLSAGFWKVRRFSLRTLLTATTLVAIVLGLMVWAAR